MRVSSAEKPTSLSAFVLLRVCLLEDCRNRREPELSEKWNHTMILTPLAISLFFASASAELRGIKETR